MSDTRWVNPPEMFRHRPVGQPVATEEFWAQVAALLERRPAVESEFVRAVSKGTAPKESIQGFTRDLRAIARELPLIEGEIASRGALHGVETVIMLSHGATLAFGYQNHAPLVDLVERFAGAIGCEPAPRTEAGLAATAFLVCVRSLGLEWFEAGIAATLVDSDWNAAADALAGGLRSHYGVAATDLACFDALRAFSGPRASEVPALIREIACSAYHQYVVLHAVRETLTLWRYLWDAWAPGAAPGRLEA